MKKLFAGILAMITALFSFANINVRAAEVKVGSIAGVETKSSLKITYDKQELSASDVDLRLGGIIPKEIYDSTLEYGVIAVARNEETRLDGADANKLLDLKNHKRAVAIKPVEVENGYQLSWVITNMEGHYDFEFAACIYVSNGTSVELAKRTYSSVISTATKYLNDEKLMLSEDVRYVLHGICGEFVKLDGKIDDKLYSNLVKEHKYTMNHNSNEVLIDTYATRNNIGIFIFIDYKSKRDNSNATAWFAGNNVEFRFVDVNGMLSNGSDPIDKNNKQFFASTAGKTNNFTKAFISTPALDSNVNMYKSSFELFISYEALGVNPNSAIGFTMGSNDGGNMWYCSENFANTDIKNNIKITENGVCSMLQESECPEHSYGEWIIVKKANCISDGLKKKICRLCNHEVTEIIPKGVHSFDEGNLIIDVEPTCTSEGKGHYECLGGCGTIKEVILPKDFNNHTQWNEAEGKCTGCGSTIKNSIDFDKMWNQGGWNQPINWNYIAKDLAGDYSLVIDFEMSVNNLPGNWWHSIIPMLEEQLPAGRPGYGGPWCTRFDWFVWQDKWESDTLLGRTDNTDEFRKTAWCSMEEYDQVVSHCYVNWKCTRVGNEIRNDFTITALDGNLKGTKYEYFSLLKDVSLDKHVNIIMTAEFAKARIDRVVYL